MKNKLIDLNNHLFAQLERLSDENVKGEALTEEIERAKAVATVSTKVIENAKLALEGEKLRLEYSGAKVRLPYLLGDPNG